MPEAEHRIKVFVRHHSDDNVSQPGRRGQVTVFKEYLETALGRRPHEVRLQGDLEAGRDLEDILAFENEAHLVVFVFSQSLIGDDAQVIRFEALNGRAKPIGILYLCTCPYDSLVNPECLMVPSRDMAVDANPSPETVVFTNAAKALASLLDDAKITESPPLVSPEQVLEQQEQVLGALLELNYTQQPREFKRCAVLSSQAMPTAFLVHGRMTYDGGRWLVSRLLRDLPDRNPRVWELNAKGAHMSVDKASNGILRSLTAKLGLVTSADYGQIKAKLLEKIQKESGTLVVQISGVDLFLLSPSLPLFEDFRTKFWEPLVAAAHSPAVKCRLILFFIAESEMDTCQHFDAYNQANPTWKPTRLQRVDAFDEALLQDWLDRRDATLNQLPLQKPLKLIDPMERDAAIKEILQNTDNGLPEMVLQYLSRLCGCEFDDLLKMLPAHESPA